MPLVHMLIDGEDAHNLAVKLAKYGLVPKSKKIENMEILVCLKRITILQCMIYSHDFFLE